MSIRKDVIVLGMTICMDEYKTMCVWLCLCVHCMYVAVSTSTVWEHWIYFWVLSTCIALYYGYIYPYSYMCGQVHLYSCV